MPAAKKKTKSTRTKTVRSAKRKTPAKATKKPAVTTGPKKSVTRKKQNYLAAVGRRKSSVARVRLMLGTDQSIEINGRALQQYFPHGTLQHVVTEPLALTNTEGIGAVTVKVRGGGARSQAESIRLGISRVLIKHDDSLKPLLKTQKLLTVDARVKERKKYGLKKARRAPQWQKR